MSGKRRRQQMVTGAGVGIGATLAMGGAAQAATITVATLEEPTDAGSVTLRQAINQSQEAQNVGSTITFASGLSGTIHLASDLPPIDQPVTIQGPGADQITISGEDAHKIFDLDSPGGPFDVKISGLTLAHASAPSGAAIDSYNANLTLSGMVLSDNKANSVGGAIWAYSQLSSLTIRDSTLTGNSTIAGVGGAIYSNQTPITIQNSTFSDNQSPYRGGAIAIDDAPDPSTIENSTLTGNKMTTTSATSSGGAVYLYGNEGGLTVTGSTIVRNDATYGGGIFNHGAFASPPVVLHNTIVSGNTASLTGPNLGGSFESAFSLLGNTDGANVAETVPGSDVLAQDPQLGDLASNGGPTRTMKPTATSPVLDMGSAFGITTDQRGQPRPFDAPTISNAPGSDASDIGAVELQASDVPAAKQEAAPVKKKKCKKKKHKRSAESAKKKKCKKKKKKG